MVTMARPPSTIFTSMDHPYGSPPSGPFEHGSALQGSIVGKKREPRNPVPDFLGAKLGKILQIRKNTFGKEINPKKYSKLKKNTRKTRKNTTQKNWIPDQNYFLQL